jgi:hypothetical protein
MVCLLEFLLGRLFGYLLFGVLAWCTKFAITGERSSMVLFGSSYVVLSVMMAVYAFHDTLTVCPAGALGRASQSVLFQKPFVFPAVLGFLTGINLCPPFLLALTETATSESISRSLVFFTLFYIGTSVYFLPLSFLGSFRTCGSIKTVAKMASVIIAIFYVHKGISMLLTAL